MSPQARREQVALACERGLSERRACGLIGLARSSLNYTLRLPVKSVASSTHGACLISPIQIYGLLSPERYTVMNEVEKSGSVDTKKPAYGRNR